MRTAHARGVHGGTETITRSRRKAGRRRAPAADAMRSSAPS